MIEFFSYMGTVSFQVLILFIMIAVGFIISKAKMINENGAAQITNILLYIVTPCVIISSFECMEFNENSVNELLISAACAVFTHIIGFILGALFFRKKEKSTRTTLICTVALSNCGFMGIPMTEALLGSHGVFLVSVYLAIFNIFVWTVSYSMFGGKFSIKSVLVNPGVIGTAIGFAIFFAKLKLPDVISIPVGYMSSLNTPLAMIVIGYYLSCAPFSLKKSDLPMLVSVSVRLIAVPLICLAIFRCIGMTGTLLTSCVIPAAAPSAAIVMMFASKFKADTLTASKGMAFSHVISIITMPLILTICSLFA